jgi:hypothetical protein
MYRMDGFLRWEPIGPPAEHGSCRPVQGESGTPQLPDLRWPQRDQYIPEDSICPVIFVSICA